MEHLQSFIKDCDRKIQIAKKRLEETQDDHDQVPEVCTCTFLYGTVLCKSNTGSKIATSWSPMHLKIECWRPEFQG